MRFILSILSILFERLAQALSALYPAAADEKRWMGARAEEGLRILTG